MNENTKSNIQKLEEIEHISITDSRDIKEIRRRKLEGGFNPPKDELYSINPDFDGNYSY